VATLHEPITPTRPQAHAARLAETATRLLPHLAVGLFRCIQQGQPTEHLIKAIAKCGKYLNAAERSAR
jgi:hypothetical protein